MHPQKLKTNFETNSNKSIKNAETVLRTLNPGIWQWYIQTGELTLNKRWAEIIGYTLDELQPVSIKTWEIFSHPDDLKKSGELLEIYFEGQTEFYEMEARMKHKNGSWIWVLDRGQVVEWDDLGKPILMIGSHIDITDHKRLEEIRSDEQYYNLIEKAPFPVLLIDAQTKNLVYGNKQALTQFKISEEKLFFSEDFYVNKTDRTTFNERMKRDGHIYDFEVELFDLTHQRFWALVSASFTMYKGSATMLLSINDITSRKNIEDSLIKERNRISLITTLMGDVIWVYNVNKDRYEYVSPSVEFLRGYTAEEMMNQSINQVITPDSLDILMAEHEERVAKLKSDPKLNPIYTNEVEQICKDGSTIWVEMSSRYRLTEDGQLEVVGSSRNIDERRKNETRIEYLNEHDSITGLKNRAAFRKFEQIQNRMNPARLISLLFIDFDHFGSTNDSFGHRMGDKIIELIANGIKKIIELRGELYHFDGDEFVVVLYTVDRSEVEQISIQINQYVAEPFLLENRLVSVSVSIGYDIGSPGQLMESLLNNASTALYVAKITRNGSKAYDESMAKSQTRELRLERDLSDAIDQKQLELYFQPIYSIKTGKVTDAEALLRWNHPEFGMVSPEEFIPIAERTRLIIPITDWVIQRTLHVLSHWDIENTPPLVISVNVSFVSLVNRGEELYKFLHHELVKSGISANRLKLEVTESSLVQDAAEVIKVFIRLKELGIRVALDDFGTGYSSFAYLKALPLDIVKIDRLLVRTLEWDQKSRIIIESMITILHALGLEVIIEGVETLAQFELLRSMKADKIQGYLFSRPLNIAAFRAYYLIAMKSGSLPVKPFNDDWTEIRMHWHSDWDSGEPTIDQQHHDLMRLTADLERLSLLDNPNPEIIKLALSTLLEAVKTHFTDEENILEHHHYDGLNEHKEAHESLLNRALAFVKQYEAGEIDLYVFVPFLVREVVWDHLLKEDVKFFHLFGTEIDERSWRQFETISSADEHIYRLQLRENAGLQALLATISARLINVDSTDADAKINQVLKLCGNHFGVDRVYIFKYDWQAKTISNTYEWCHEGIEPQIDQLQDGPMELYEDWINAHIQGESIIVDKVTDLDPASGLRQVLEPQGIISLISVPLIADNICSGFLGFDSVRRKHTYSHLEHAMLMELSNLLLVTLKRKAIDEQLAREKLFYELTVSALDVGLILVDTNRRITFINPLAERLIGKNLIELRGLDIRQALELVDLET
ncbi:MAG: EAL domain-containing protein, partial [Erysipelotrichaceae bacterium]